MTDDRDLDPRVALDELERAEAAPYVNYPATPWWHFPLMGLWAGAMVGAFVWWRESALLFVGAMVVLVAIETAYLVWLSRTHGALPMPGRGTPPAELAPVWRGYFIGVAVVVVGVGLVWWLLGIAAAAVTAFVLVTGGLAEYDRRYERAAARTRARLGIAGRS
ncbi:hypothetical protein PSU4_08540 [Pseudonocardia sulfidoxydans NBRC 16205]|uniref:Uncharacterized protein n=1 Tax=Pseudonocardia sulfidoxydans NBRC 16205 TaxID=1223511 RepID=A0A511DAR8_9PSEU|nr:hypothetical protein [Pseudonocardia sulfidoxydans]GEL21900.1 hypothetical protein PSU4_08540 [Pseudonocardia sulfidoxydans NBRC 16205]